jgi:hypothetical protein
MNEVYPTSQSSSRPFDAGSTQRHGALNDSKWLEIHRQKAVLTPDIIGKYGAVSITEINNPPSIWTGMASARCILITLMTGPSCGILYKISRRILYVVGSSIMDLRDVRSWSTSLTVEALRNARARVFALVIRAMQEPCPASSQTLLL